MKNNKRGFSLAEVLIAVTIAAIIATMGFTIAKKGIARAYDRYVYTGYYSIAAVLSDAVDTHGYTINECGNLQPGKKEEGACEFSERVTRALSGRRIQWSNNSLDFNTPNGINYHIERIDRINRTPTTEEPNPAAAFRYLIRMDVPTVKTRRNLDHKTACMLFIENFTQNENAAVKSYSNILLPIRCNNGGVIDNDRFFEDIQDRRDLLAFYFDDTRRGKVIRDNAGNDIYYPRRFRTAREAMCIKYSRNNGIIPQTLNGYLNCPANIEAETWENNETILKITDPRRI